MNEEQDALAKSALHGNTAVKSPPLKSASVSASYAAPAIKLPESAVLAADLATKPSIGVGSQPNRCLTCRKRIGLTGFKYRCGSVFCGPHRYPEQHGCTFDYKAMGKEEIAKANPIVKPAKSDGRLLLTPPCTPDLSFANDPTSDQDSPLPVTPLPIKLMTSRDGSQILEEHEEAQQKGR